MKKLTLLSLSAIILLSAFSLADAPNPLQGRWELNSVFQGQPYSFLVVFRASGNYDGFLNKKIFVSGTYNVKHDTLYIADPICNSNYFGTYKLSFIGGQDSVQFKVIQDTCRARREGVNGFVYKKLKPTGK